MSPTSHDRPPELCRVRRTGCGFQVEELEGDASAPGADGSPLAGATDPSGGNGTTIHITM